MNHLCVVYDHSIYKYKDNNYCMSDSFLDTKGLVCGSMSQAGAASANSRIEKDTNRGRCYLDYE